MCTVTAFTDAFAAKYVLSVSGKVDQISALQNSVAVPTPSGTVSIGDDYTIEARFDTGTAELTALYDADPTINIYYLPGTQVTARIGSYTTSFSPGFSMNASIQLWNGYVVVNPTDAQSFQFFNYNLSALAPRPFVMGTGLTSENLTFNAFDFTATARNSDLISELVPLSAFANQSFNYGILNSDTNLFVYVGARITSATLAAAAVPEPATWLFITIGFGLIGGAVRKSKNLKAMPSF
jgi:hypothetical protein